MVASALCLVLLVMTSLTSAPGMLDSEENDLKALLKRLNRPAIICFRKVSGEIIDCVRFEDQLSMQDPEIRKDAIKMGLFVPETSSSEPKSHVLEDEDEDEDENEEEKNESNLPIWHENNTTCPQGTVCIARVTREQVLMSTLERSIEDFGKKPHCDHPSR